MAEIKITVTPEMEHDVEAIKHSSNSTAQEIYRQAIRIGLEKMRERSHGDVVEKK